MAGKRHQDIFAAAMDWQPGTDDGIEYVRFAMDEDNPESPMMVLSRFAPGAQVQPHTHGSNYFEYIIEGQQTVGKTAFHKGDVRLVKRGVGYGPIRVGPDGCTVLVVFENRAQARMRELPFRPARAA